MNLPAPPPPPPPPQPPIGNVVKGECVNCGWKDRLLLHRVILRGADRRVCTSCVLRLHPSAFCPSCFEFFDHPLSATSSAAAHRFISCVKCSSLTHLRCLPSPPPAPSSFLCPPCSKANFTFFPVPESPLDKDLAAVLLCASKVASASIAKNVAIATTRADRAVREAAAARKRVKEAIDHYSELEGSGSRNLELHHNAVSKNEVQVLPSEALSLPQHNNNGDSGNSVIVKDKHVVSEGRLGNREQDPEQDSERAKTEKLTWLDS